MEGTNEQKAIETIKTILGDCEEVSGQSIILGVGEILCGIFMGITDRKDNDNNDIKIVMIEGETGLFEMRVNERLQSVLSNIKIGENICILRTEDGKSKAGRTFKNYRVFKAKKQET